MNHHPIQSKIVTVLAAAILIAPLAALHAAESSKPNIIFVLFGVLTTFSMPIIPPSRTTVASLLKQQGWLFQGDAMLGQVFEALERNKLADNTLIMVSSDNGAAGREYAPLRAAKTSIYEGGHRVPFLARWPGKIKAGSVCDDTICLNDLMATSAEIIGTKLPDNAGEDSLSILPDLSEKTDVAASNPEVVEKLTTLMKKYIADGRSTAGAPQKNDFDLSITGENKDKQKKKKDKKAEKLK